MVTGVDGVVFVSDSQVDRLDANLESLDNLRDNLDAQGYDLDRIPWVVQYNKRDLPTAIQIDYLRSVINPTGVPDFEAVATTGEGVFETLKSVAKNVLVELKKGR